MNKKIDEREVIGKYLGIPYVNRGRSLTSGLDCWGLIILIYRDLGFDLFDLEAYEVDWARRGGNHFIENYWRQWRKIERPEFLDGVLFLDRRGIANHAGLMLDQERFIHCCRVGVIVSNLNDGNWKMKREGFYRLNARD